jgi:hypothetical protein
MRFYGLRLHEVGMIELAPRTQIHRRRAPIGVFVDEIRRELKT